MANDFRRALSKSRVIPRNRKTSGTGLKAFLVGRERNDVGRPHDEGYPTRGIVKDGWLYLHNFEPSRWPACNPFSGYLDCDGSPTKTEILKARPGELWSLSFGLRPADELYDLAADPDCMKNLAGKAECQARQTALRDQLFAELKKQKDPRVLGQDHALAAASRHLPLEPRIDLGRVTHGHVRGLTKVHARCRLPYLPLPSPFFLSLLVCSVLTARQ